MDADGVSVGAMAKSVAAALVQGDATSLVATMPAGETDVRVEIRQSLVETDERNAESLKSAEAARSWLERTRPRWSCRGGDCEWPGGLVTGDLAVCAGDCCSSDYPRGLEKRTLYLKRVCFAAREGRQVRLSYLGFVEAK